MAKLGTSFQTAKITQALVELALEEWKQETTIRKKPEAQPQRRGSSATLRTRALHLSNPFGALYPDRPNPVLALKDHAGLNAIGSAETPPVTARPVYRDRLNVARVAIASKICIDWQQGCSPTIPEDPSTEFGHDSEPSRSK